MRTCFGQVLAYHTPFSSLVIREKSTCCFVPESRNKRRNTKEEKMKKKERKEYIKEITQEERNFIGR